jgi:hypothetical protein
MLDKVLLRKRALIECVNDQLKNISHTNLLSREYSESSQSR